MTLQGKRAGVVGADRFVLEPVDRTLMTNANLHEEIYAAMRRALVAGDFVPGQVFPMRQLAERFGTSLVPVRDALKLLVAERALAMLPNRTVCVPLMTRERFQELLQARLGLETILARRGCELIGHEAVLELDAINEDMQASVVADEPKRYLAANHRFHFGLYAAAGSSVILPLVESLWMQVGPFMHGVFNARGTRSARDHHAEVLKALRRRDPEAAAQAIYRDLADAADVILAREGFVLDGESDMAPRALTKRSGAAG